MATVKTQNGNVLLKDGLVSCECCDEAVPCGTSILYSGGASFPATRTITLGTNTGLVTLNYNAFNVPDRFVVVYNGVDVIDTGYVGAGGSYPPPVNTVVGPGLGSATFTKSTANPTTAIVLVFAPFASTLWNFRLSCPNSAP